MTKVNVWFNDGRWIVRCPVCELKTELKPRKKIKNLRIKWHCGNCHPGKIQRVLKITPAGSIAYSYSRKAQIQAAENAYNADEIHIAVFPKDWKEAEKILRLRHKKHQHYRPHEIYPKTGKYETAADLVAENKEEVEIIKPTKAVKEVVIERKELPLELYKELQ